MEIDQRQMKTQNHSKVPWNKYINISISYMTHKEEEKKKKKTMLQTWEVSLVSLDHLGWIIIAYIFWFYMHFHKGREKNSYGVEVERER